MARSARTPRRWGMTVSELLLAAVVLAVALAAVTGLYAHLVDEAKSRDTTQLIATLAHALDAYYAKTGEYPLGPAASAGEVIEQLLTEPASAQVIHEATPIRETATIRAAASTAGVLRPADRLDRDPWGTPIRYMPAGAVAPLLTGRLLLAGGEPIFESAGPDRDFGDTDTRRQSDNIRSDEPLSINITAACATAL